MVLETYPLDNVDYSAEDAELFHCTRSSGIYANDDFDYSVTGADNTITIGVGLGWIRNSRFSGKVVALKAAMTLDMGLPDAVYPRIDAVVIQFDANKNGTEIAVKRGVSASAPAAPAISKTESLYELHLYHVRREPGASAVSVSNITDLRLDPNYCGLMADSVTKIDTAAISAQVNALIESLRQEIQSVKDGSAYLMRSGGAMSGPINMNGQAIKGLNAPTADDEAVNWGSVKNAAGVGIPLPLGLEYGGTGATDPQTARENLEITPENIGAEPVGAMRMELLWENASPTSEFGWQTVNFKDIDPESFRICFGSQDGHEVATIDIKPGEKGIVSSVVGSDGFGQGAATVFTRLIVSSSKTHMEFYNAGYTNHYLSWNQWTNTNGMPIPWRIYGIKGG